MRATFIRHGQSTGNAGIACHDLASIALTELGHGQAHEIAADWLEINFPGDTIDRSRAHQCSRLRRRCQDHGRPQNNPRGVVVLNLTATSANRATMIRLRKIQRRVNAEVNAIVLYLSTASELHLTADQWTSLWNRLEAATLTLQQLSEKTVAEKQGVDKRRRDFRATGAGTEGEP